MRHLRMGLTAALLPLILAADARADGKTTQIYEQTVRGTALVRAGKQGTGWLLDRDKKLLVTSLRNLGKEPAVEVVFPEFKEDKLMVEREHYEAKRAIGGKVILRDVKRDLALIELDAVPDGILALKLAGDSPAAGERLHAVANTIGSQGLWCYSAGIVRQVYRRKENALDCSVVVSQLPINPGDSGAPVVNDAGELVGVAASSVEKTRLVTLAIDVVEVRRFADKFVTLRDRPPARPAPTPEQPARLSGDAIFARMLSGTVWIASAEPKRTAGTGCLVDRKRKLVLTSLAVAGKDETLKVWFPAYEKGKLIGQREHYQKRTEPILARVIERQPRLNLAVLELESLPKDALELPLAAEGALPADEVSTIGNPIFATGLWVFHSGVARQSFHGKARAKEPDWNGRVLETQTPFNPGDSGGPVVNSRGELVGIVDAPVPNTKYVTNCIDVSEIRHVLSQCEHDTGGSPCHEFMARPPLVVPSGR